MENLVVEESVDDFDLDSIFMDDGVSVGLDVGVFECENPHWAVMRDDFRKVLQIVYSFPSKSTVFMAVWQEGSNLCVHANNRDALVDVKIPIINKDPYKTDKVYFLDTSKLLAFVNAYKQFVFSFDADGTIYYESPFVRYRLDVLKVSLNDILIKYDTIKDWVKFPLTKGEIGTLKTLYTFAIKLSDSKVLLDTDKSEAFYTLYKYSVIRKTNLSEKVVIRRLDLPTIQEIAEDGLSFAFTKDRLFFKFGFGVVSFLRVSYDEESFMYPNTFATGDEVGRYTFDVKVIKQALKLSGLFKVDEVEFVSENQDIFMLVSEKAKFKVGSGSLSSSFELGVDTFAKLLGTVGDNESSVSVIVTSHGVDLVLSNGVQYSLSRISTSQLKNKGVKTSTQTTSSVVQGASVVKQASALVEDKELF